MADKIAALDERGATCLNLLLQYAALFFMSYNHRPLLLHICEPFCHDLLKGSELAMFFFRVQFRVQVFFFIHFAVLLLYKYVDIIETSVVVREANVKQNNYLATRFNSVRNQIELTYR